MTRPEEQICAAMRRSVERRKALGKKWRELDAEIKRVEFELKNEMIFCYMLRGAIEEEDNEES